MANAFEINGPIPGENYTSDTRNYPWHRPPQFVDYDEAIDYMIEQIDESKATHAITTLMEMEQDVVTITTILLLNAISDGRISVDLALLISGPIARYLKIVGEGMGVKVDMGLKEDPPITLEHLKLMAGITSDAEEEEEIVEEVARTELPSGGLMGAPSPMAASVAPAEEQNAMLGFSTEEEVMQEGAV
jgi:hypothetical protein